MLLPPSSPYRQQVQDLLGELVPLISIRHSHLAPTVGSVIQLRFTVRGTIIFSRVLYMQQLETNASLSSHTGLPRGGGTAQLGPAGISTHRF